MPLELDTQNLLGKYALIYGYHLIKTVHGRVDGNFEYMFDTSLPCIDYLAREKRQKIKVLALGTGTHNIPFEGGSSIRAVVSMTKEGSNVLQLHHEELIKHVVLECDDEDGRCCNDRLVKFIEHAKKHTTDLMDAHADDKSKIRKYLYNIANGGDWELMHAAPRRKLDSVFLPPKEKQRLAQFVNDFKSKEVRDEYARFNIPYKFNIMLYGRAGMGKSSTIMSLASELGSDIAIMSFSSEITDSHLIKAVNRLVQLDNCRVLVMEDIDCLFCSGRKEGDAARNSVSLSGLLNILDGVSRAEGLVVCMTTNNIDAIDEAMLRAGRVDAKIKYEFVCEAQVLEMLGYYFGDSVAPSTAQRFAERMANKSVTTSMLQQFFFERRSRPGEILGGLDELLEMRNTKESLNRSLGHLGARDAMYN